jgi:dimethylamine corrinoid protein
MNDLIDALLDGDQEQAVTEAEKLLKENHKREILVKDGIEEAMKRLDAKCTAEQFNLLEIMLSGRAVMAVMKVLYPPGETEPISKGTIVVGALEGDMHDLGKNIFKMILTANGYRVVDCGKDCPMEKLIETAICERALAIAISALLTTMIPQLRQVKILTAEKGLNNLKVLAGGGALQQASAEGLNVDFVGLTVFDGVHFLDSLAEKNDE